MEKQVSRLWWKFHVLSTELRQRGSGRFWHRVSAGPLARDLAARQGMPRFGVSPRFPCTQPLAPAVGSPTTHNECGMVRLVPEILRLCVTDSPHMGDVGPIITRVGSPVFRESTPLSPRRPPCLLEHCTSTSTRCAAHWRAPPESWAAELGPAHTRRPVLPRLGSRTRWRTRIPVRLACDANELARNPKEQAPSLVAPDSEERGLGRASERVPLR